MLLKVFVGDIAIAVFIKVAEHFVGVVLAALKRHTLNLAQQTSQSSRSGLVFNDVRSRLFLAQILIDKGRGRVCSDPARHLEGQLVCVLLKNEGSNAGRICRPMFTILERGQESFEVFLGEASLSNVLCAQARHESFHFLHANVPVFVCVDLLSQMSLQVLFSFKFVTNVSVDAQKLPFNVFEFVRRHRLRIQNAESVISARLPCWHVERVATGGDRALTFGQNARIGLLVVVETSQVCSHVCVAQLPRRFVHKLAEVRVQFAHVLCLRG